MNPSSSSTSNRFGKKVKIAVVILVELKLVHFLENDVIVLSEIRTNQGTGD